MMRFVPVAVGVLLIVICTVLQGRITSRWSNELSESVRLMAERFSEIPDSAGSWQGLDKKQLSEKISKAAGAQASMQRIYVNKDTGDRVSVFLITGYSRDIAAHLPIHCYAGAGYKQRRDEEIFPMVIDGKEQEFFTTVFERRSAGRFDNQRIYWSWSSNGEWVAPALPRIEFGARTALTKVYLIQDLNEGGSKAVNQSPCIPFAQAFLPELNNVLFSKSKRAHPGNEAVGS